MAEALLRHLLEGNAVDLAGRVDRHLLEHDDVLRRVVADPRPGEGDQLVQARSRRAILERDEGADVLAMHEIVYADHPGDLHRRVLDQRFLDLLRADVGAVMHDDLLAAAAEPQIAVGVDPHHVAGIEPAILDRRAGRLWIGPIADRIAGRLDPQAAFPAGRDPRAALLADRHLVPPLSTPDRAYV